MENEDDQEDGETKEGEANLNGIKEQPAEENEAEDGGEDAKGDQK